MAAPMLVTTRILLVGFTAFSYYTVAALLGEPTAPDGQSGLSVPALTMRALSSLVLGTALVLGEQRFPSRSVAESVRAGAMLGAIVATTDLVFDPRNADPLRALIILASLPLLTTVTHYARRVVASSDHGSA